MKKGCCDFNFTETEKGFKVEFNGAELKERFISWFKSCGENSTKKGETKAESCCKESPEKR